jgi:hypothetical protein
MDLTTWSPFQSRQVQEICAHMTASEKSRAWTRGFGYGMWVCVTVAGPLAFGWWSASTPLRVGAWALLGVHVCALPYWLRQTRRFLCSTAWAQGQGVAPDQLTLFQFRSGRPVSNREHR